MYLPIYLHSKIMSAYYMYEKKLLNPYNTEIINTVVKKYYI